MKTEKMDKKESALIITWVVVLLIGLTIPQCTKKNAQRANEEYQRLIENTTNSQIVD